MKKSWCWGLVLVGLGMCCLYLVLAPLRIENIDGQMRFEVAWAVLTKGAPLPDNTDYLRLVSISSKLNPDVKISYFGPGHSLLSLPLLLLSQLVFGESRLAGEIVFSLVNQLVAALVVVVYFVLVVHLGHPGRRAFVCALFLGLGSCLFPAALSTMENPQVALLLLLLCLALVKHRPVLAGAAFGALLLLRENDALAALPLCVALFLGGGSKVQRNGKLLRFALALVPFVGLALGYNYYRYGGPFSLGGRMQVVLDQGWPIFGDPTESLYGLTISPEKGLLWYSPLLLVCFVGIPSLWRRHARLCTAMLLCSVLTLVSVLPYAAWRGDWTWGPRYLFGIAPLLFLGFPGALDVLLLRGRWILGVVLVPLCTIALLVQFAGVSVHSNRFFLDEGLDLRYIYGLRQLPAESPTQIHYHLRFLPEVIQHSKERLHHADFRQEITPSLDLAAAPRSPRYVQQDGQAWVERYATFDCLPYFWVYYDLASRGTLRAYLRGAAIVLLVFGMMFLLTAYLILQKTDLQRGDHAAASF